MKVKIKTMNNTHHTDSSWEKSIIEKLLMQTYKAQQRARVMSWIRNLLWILIIISILVSFNKEQYTQYATPHTAIIDLSGTISDADNQAALIHQGLTAAYNNPNVKGIILRANSPGGSAVVSSVAFQEIQYLKKQHPEIPLYVQIEDVCASGCYYIASAADKIYANPSSVVGSIGVISASFDLTELMDKLGIKRRLKIAGDNKGMGDPFSPETPEQSAIWQKMLNDIHEEFIQAVKLGRGKRLQVDANPDLFSGRIYTGKEAKSVGLIDDYGTIYSISRDIFQAPDLIDYTPEDSFGKTLSRYLGTEVQNSLRYLGTQIW